MRLRRLEFANVGPFVGRHLIDFEQLASPLFLIDGPTGVGKSTIIDAIVYALYDRVAAENSDAGRLRSMHASPVEETYVELDFEVQDRVYRIRRSPAYLRKAKKGGGLTRNQPQVALYENVSGAWQFREDKAQPVGAEVKRIIGLDREQFIQTVVLPQGEFAKFLHATSAERKPILQRIFHTSGFEALEAAFAKRAEAARELRTEVLTAIERVRAQLENELDGANHDDESAQQRRDEAAALSEAVETARRSHEKNEEQLALAKRRSAAVTALELAAGRVERAEAALAACDPPSDQRSLAELNARAAELKQQRDRFRKLREGDEQAALRLEALAAAAQKQVELDAADALLAADIQRSLTLAEEHVQAATKAELQQRASALAAELVPGEPCCVCGSVDHPNPAVRSTVTIALGSALDTAARLRTLRDELVLAQPLPASRVSEIDLADVERRRKASVREREALDVRRVTLIAEESAWNQRRAELAVDAVSIEELDDAIAAAQEAIATLTAFEAARAALGIATADRDTAATNEDLALPNIELDAAIEAVQRSAAQVAQLSAELREAAKRVEKLDALVAQLRDVEQRALDVERETATVIRLANIVAGKEDNLLQQPLSVFVLQTMFDDVIDAANARLAGMLNGRYELCATEESNDRRRSSAGLDLVVIDHVVDEERAARTLSGGETFCVSLALALGLADTVHAYSGGVSIDTLFIDEGFGSLDPATLDDVMSELERLGQDGRIVGVISHVEAMKAISERIDIRALPESGSAISVTWA